MSQFEERQAAFEAKFAQNAEMQFKAEARRDKMLAAWAAEFLGKDAAEYAGEVIRADLEEAGSDDVVRKLVADLEGHASEEEIRAKLAEFDAQAKSDLLEE